MTKELNSRGSYGILGDTFIRLVNKMEGYPIIDCKSITNKYDDAGTTKGS